MDIMTSSNDQSDVRTWNMKATSRYQCADYVTSAPAGDASDVSNDVYRSEQVHHNSMDGNANWMLNPGYYNTRAFNNYRNSVQSRRENNSFIIFKAHLIL